jgi:hypothetical protein
MPNDLDDEHGPVAFSDWTEHGLCEIHQFKETQ